MAKSQKKRVEEQKRLEMEIKKAQIKIYEF